MVIVSVGVIGSHDEPLYIRTFQEEDDLESHFVIHMSLDLVDAKMATKGGDMYLGFLGPIEDNKVYGYVTNTKVKFILVLQEGPVKEVMVKSFFNALHKFYVQVISNPFNTIGDTIESESFDQKVYKLVLEHNTEI